VDSISFDRIADRYDASRGGAARARNVAAGVAPHLVEGRVLEVGVGTGAVAGALRALGRDCVGVDLSEAMLRRALDRVGPRVVRGDAHHLPVRSRSCPNVLFVWVLHLVGDPVAALAEASRVLADGGRVVAVIDARRPDEEEIGPIVEALRSALRRPALITDDVVQLATAAGLTPMARGTAPERTYLDSPAQAAAAIEQRTFSYLWGLDPETWNTVVQPAITALRALPDPDRGRLPSARQDITVFTA
jgi:SAM-dependent methyltransferase